MMKKRLILTAVVISAMLVSCSKEAGPGGTSAITGSLYGETIDGGGSSAESEVTTVVCTHANGIDGSILDNSDYFLLNTPEGSPNYYVWYENTNWLGQDPGLSGRTGIKVTYSNSESNLTIATNTLNAISTVAPNDFSLSLDGDILTIVNTQVGEVADAEDINTPFAIDVANQGKSAVSGSGTSVTGPIADERVYLIYGDEDFYSESVRTDAEGMYQFKGLTKGNYRVFAFSLDPAGTSSLLIQKEVSVEISKNKEVVSAETIEIIR